MHRLIILVIIILFPLSVLYSQGVMKVTTDKSVYSYGEPIRVRMTVTNNTDSAFSVRGSSSCISRLTFNEKLFSKDCTMDDTEYKFPPGASWVWIWDINPEQCGLPDNDSIQTIYGSVSRWYDLAAFKAPKYYGGLLSVTLLGKYYAKEVQYLRDSFNVSLLKSTFLGGSDSLFHETWKVRGHSLDSIITVLSKDFGIRSINRAWTIPSFAAYLGVSSTSHYGNSRIDFKLNQNYPNPFNPGTTISYSLPKETHIEIKVYDILGREVSTLINKEQTAGEYKVQFDGTSLPSGVYIYTIWAGEYNASRKLMLLK